MSIFEIFLSQDDILQRSTGCNKKNSCHQPSLISQCRENVISFNFLANALAVHFKITNWKTCCRTVSYHWQLRNVMDSIKYKKCDGLS